MFLAYLNYHSDAKSQIQNNNLSFILFIKLDVLVGSNNGNLNRSSNIQIANNLKDQELQTTKTVLITCIGFAILTVPLYLIMLLDPMPPKGGIIDFNFLHSI